MNGSTWFEESQWFPPWMYVLVSVVFLVLLAVLTLHQTTRVEGDAVTVSFGFLYTKRVSFAEIARAEAVTYRPIRDYGGWGIRGFGRRRALNTRGNAGRAAHARGRIDAADRLAEAARASGGAVPSRRSDGRPAPGGREGLLNFRF